MLALLQFETRTGGETEPLRIALPNLQQLEQKLTIFLRLCLLQAGLEFVYLAILQLQYFVCTHCSSSGLGGLLLHTLGCNREELEKFNALLRELLRM